MSIYRRSQSLATRVCVTATACGPMIHEQWHPPEPQSSSASAVSWFRRPWISDCKSGDAAARLASHMRPSAAAAGAVVPTRCHSSAGMARTSTCMCVRSTATQHSSGQVLVASSAPQRTRSDTLAHREDMCTHQRHRVRPCLCGAATRAVAVLEHHGPASNSSIRSGNAATAVLISRTSCGGRSAAYGGHVGVLSDQHGECLVHASLLHCLHQCLCQLHVLLAHLGKQGGVGRGRSEE